jgi:transposase-like protein
MLRLIEENEVVETEFTSALDELVRKGARMMLESALAEEVASYIERHKTEVDDVERRLVTRNGKAQKRKVTTGAGTFEIEAPRVRDLRVDEHGQRQKFTSKILPPYMRKSPNVAEVIPILYLRGLSTGDFSEALSTLLGSQASGLSASSIARLTDVWRGEYAGFKTQRFDDKRFAYVWVDGIHFRVRLEEARLCTLVIIGVREDGSKELIAVEDGYRESAESWSEILRDLKRRGLIAPNLAIGDGALGFWKAVTDVWPETKHQRCWVHKLANVLDKFPKRNQPRAKQMLHEIMMADSKQHALDAIEEFKKTYEDKYPKAVNNLTKDIDALLEFYNYPAAHWKHIRTTNAIESSFATVRLRQRVTKGAGSRVKALTMAFKLLELAEKRWRKISSPALIADVLNQVTYEDGLKKDAA